MTREAVGRSRPGVTKAWIIPLGVLVGIVLAVMAGLLSRAVILDLIAWWPVWVALGLLAWVARGRKLGSLRIPGLVAMIGVVMAVLFTVGHILGWAVMPSAAARLIGPEVGDTERGVLTATIEGTLNLETGATFLYELFPIRRGGEVAVPNATEDTVETTVIISLDQPDDPGFQTFAGWNLRISEIPAWDLELGGWIRTDLSRIVLTGLKLSGSGEIKLGIATGLTEVSVRGDYVIEVPPTAVVSVVGEAQVPPGWERVEDGWQSPLTGAGWVVTVEPGATVVITTSS